MVFDKWYFYSWYRVWSRLSEIRNYIERYNLKKLLVLEEHLKRLRKYQVLVNRVTKLTQKRKLIGFLKEKIISSREGEIDLARLVSKQIISEEDEATLEYMLLSNPDGLLKKEAIRANPIIRINDLVFNKKKALVKGNFLNVYKLNPYVFAEYSITKVASLVNLPIEQVPGYIPMNIQDFMKQLQISVCVENKCQRDIKRNVEDLSYAVSIDMYTQNTKNSVVVVPIPLKRRGKLECFRCSIKFLSEQNRRIRYEIPRR